MDKILILLLCFYLSSAKIKINKLDVPSAILYGSQDDVILDCDFDSGGDEVTEIKWFINGDNQIYQWLPSASTKAQAIGKLKNHIDTTYKATNDEKTMYRALHIVDLSPEISGNYTCKVSSLNSEDVATKAMVIYVTPDDFAEDDDEDDSILDIEISEENSEITCSAGGFYPEPNMTLYITNNNDNDNETEILSQENAESVELNEEGYYNVSATLKFNMNNLSQIFYYTCALTIPGTPYNISETSVFVQADCTELEVSIEEGFYNATNSTDSSLEESTEIETQIEEESDISTTTTAQTDIEIDDDVTNMETEIFKESGAFRHLPSVLTMVLLTSLLSSLC